MPMMSLEKTWENCCSRQLICLWLDWKAPIAQGLSRACMCFVEGWIRISPSLSFPVHSPNHRALLSVLLMLNGIKLRVSCLGLSIRQADEFALDSAEI